MTKSDPFKGFQSSPGITRLAVMLYIRFPLSLRNVEDLLHERGVEISHETVRFCWRRSGPKFASDIGRTDDRKLLQPRLLNKTLNISELSKNDRAVITC